MKNSKPGYRVGRLWTATLLMASIPGCAREVDVDGDEPSGAAGRENTSGGGGRMNAGGSAGMGTDDSPLIDAIDQAPDGGSGPTGSGGTAGGAGGSVNGTGDGGTDSGSESMIVGIELLDDALNFLTVPSVGSTMVSLLQYTSAGLAVTRHIDWSTSAGSWYEAASAYHIDTAAAGTRQLSVVYAGSTYGVYANGEATELSGTPETYKEYLAANEDGFAWVNYEPSSSSGAIVFQTWSGDRRALTDALPYRSELELSNDHLVFVEYAGVGPSAIGQVMLQSLAGGAAVPVAASSRHQANPAVDGDWVVWEEYLDSADSVIRAHHIPDGETRDISTQNGFRTHAHVLGNRVVWEDQRSGDGNIYFASLTDTAGERIVVSGSGHSTAPRLTSDGLVWLEANASLIGLLRARWAP